MQEPALRRRESHKDVILADHLRILLAILEHPFNFSTLVHLPFRSQLRSHYLVTVFLTVRFTKAVHYFLHTYSFTSTPRSEY